MTEGPDEPIRFAVWAPHADGCQLLTWMPRREGNWTRDDPDASTPMEPTEDGWWFVDAVGPVGTEYLFELRLGDEVLRRLDPRARGVTNSVGRSLVCAPFLDWTDDGFEARPLNEWVIYELHPGTFGGDLDGVVAHLDHLEALGVTAIELMPVAEFAGDLSWGYNPAMPYAVESSYGGPHALCRLVDAAHARGMAVILDVVYNHLGPSDLDLWRFDGWSEGDGGGIYFYNDDRAATPWGATRPDYGRGEVRTYLIDNARMWLGEYHLDGLRLDSTTNIRNRGGGGDPFADLEDGWRFLTELTSTLRAEFPRAVLIAEDLLADPRVTAPVDAGGLGFHLQWAAEFVHPVRAALMEIDDFHRDMGGVVGAVVGGPDGGARVVYTESHDEVANGQTRMPAEIDRDAPGAVHAIRRSVAGGVLMTAALGVPMIFQGQEWAEEDWFDDSVEVRWQRREERAGLVTLWGDLVRLRTGADDRAPALRGDRVEAWHRDGVVVVRRWGLGGAEAACLAVVNLTGVERRVELPESDAGWTLVFAADWSGYHDSGEDRTEVVDRAVVLPAYGSAILSVTR